MKRTTTTPNRFIIYTRSWWAKSATLFSLLVLFFSCEEDLNSLGFKSTQKRFKVYYAEIPVASSVLLMDSLRTSNVSTEETNRLQIGSYDDPEFGTVRAEAYAQFRPQNFAAAIPQNSTFDSIVLRLQYDFYLYGRSGQTNLGVSVHEITEDISNRIYSTSNVIYDPTSLGNTTSPIDATFFTKEAEDTDRDSVITIRVKLNQDFGLRLYNAVNPNDENYTNFNNFKTRFKGLAIIPTQADKIAGLSNTSSSLIVYHHVGDVKSTSTFFFPLGGHFTKISADRSATALAGLSQFRTDFNPVNNNRYVQSGTSIVTKLDFSKFYAYMDSLTSITINSAELSIDNINPDGGFSNPSALSLGLLTDNNRFKYRTTKQDSLDFLDLAGPVIIGSAANRNLPPALFAGIDEGGLLALFYSKTTNNYSRAYPTLLFQRLFDLKKNKRFPFWAFVPASPGVGKSVNRTVFPKDNIKLKIYYTRPLINSTE